MTAQVPGHQDVAVSPPHILARCQELVRPALEAAVSRLHPRLGRMAAFSFGWCDVDGVPAPGGGGKGVRQALAVLSAEAAAGPAEVAVAGAVAVELTHAFSLVHDDIMDGDERRRHRATIWKAYGIGPAVLAGDALLALAMGAVISAPGEHVASAAGHLVRAVSELIDGQAEDLSFEARPWTGRQAVTVEQYRAMAIRKTGALLGCASVIGAALAGAPHDLTEGLSTAGRCLGLAFQAVDDLLGIWGDPAATGKPVFNDLRQGKKTLPVIAALSSGTDAGRQLARLLGSGSWPPADEETAWRAASLVRAAGGQSFAREEARQQLDRALRILGEVPLDPEAASQLAALALFIVDRER